MHGQTHPKLLISFCGQPVVVLACIERCAMPLRWQECPWHLKSLYRIITYCRTRRDFTMTHHWQVFNTAVLWMIAYMVLLCIVVRVFQCVLWPSGVNLFKMEGTGVIHAKFWDGTKVCKVLAVLPAAIYSVSTILAALMSNVKGLGTGHVPQCIVKAGLAEAFMWGCRICESTLLVFAMRWCVDAQVTTALIWTWWRQQSM